MALDLLPLTCSNCVNHPLTIRSTQCALKTLKTLWGLEETDFFHVSMGIDFDPRVGAFKEVMQVVQKYTAYFARENNEECEQSCMADRSGVVRDEPRR